jgi:hypothetical protein
MRRGCNLFLQSEMSHRTTSNQCKSLLAFVPLWLLPLELPFVVMVLLLHQVQGDVKHLPALGVSQF